MDKELTISQFLALPSPNKAIADALGERKNQFVASVVSLAKSNPKIEACTRESLLAACMTAASLNLPINPSLGFAYIIPYDRKTKNGDKWETITEAQFQMGYKGFIQLVQRSSQIKTINVTDVREGEIVRQDFLSGEFEFDCLEENRDKAKVIGYVAFIRLVNGFEKSLYMTVAELEKHGERFSKSYNAMDYGKKNYVGLWRTDFDVMARKTVLKLLLSKYAPMTTEIEKAISFDQAVIRDGQADYVDNDRESVEVIGEQKNDEWEKEAAEAIAQERKEGRDA